MARRVSSPWTFGTLPAVLVRDLRGGDDVDLSFTMLWDATFESWVAPGVASQPASMLFSPEGELLGSWFGRIPEDTVIELVS